VTKETALANPFEAYKATDYSDRQIWDYWVDLSGGSLLSLINPTSKTPLYVLGGKGSGKTHLMRYCSFPIQKLQHDKDLLAGLRRDQYVGLYLHTDGLNTGRFAGKGQPDDVWKDVFAYFLELWIAEQALTAIEDLLVHVPPRDQVEKEMVKRVVSLFDEYSGQPPGCVADLAAEVKRVRRELDFLVNNAAMTHKLDVRIRLTPGRAIFGIPKILSESIPKFGKVQTLYLIDELENLSEAQQKFVNTLVRHRQGPCSFRLGARLYGVKTFETFSADERNREGSEYEVLLLDARLRDNIEYAQFARKLCAMRLKEYGFLGDKEHDIGEISTRLDDQFAQPSSDHFWQRETLRLVEKFSPEDRPYLRRLRKALEAGRRSGTAPGISTDEDIGKVVSKLIFAEYPLLEKANLLAFYESWYRGHDLKKAALQIERECKELVENPKADSLLRETLNHYKSDLLAQLYRECGYRPVYAGIKSFIQMSAGIPRDLLVILKDVFSWSAFNGEHPFQEGQISVSSQQEAVVHSADWFFEDAVVQGSDAPAVKASIERLAELFRNIRFSDKPVECSLATISINTGEISSESRRILRLAENWSYLIRISEGQRDKNSQRVDEKYQLHPMLAPRWDLPTGRRGALPLSKNLANAIFDRSFSQSFPDLLGLRIATMAAPTFGKVKDAGSYSLEFDE